LVIIVIDTTSDEIFLIDDHSHQEEFTPRSLKQKRTGLTQPWDLSLFKSTILKSYTPWLRHLTSMEIFPTVQELNHLWTAMGNPPNFQFAVQPYRGQRKQRAFRKELKQQGISLVDYYVQNILNHKKIPTRENNWHDFFNFLTWCRFYKLKIKLMMLYGQDSSSTSGGRSALKDKITCFDEGGVICVVPKKLFAEAIVVLSSRDLKEKALFVQENSCQVLLFGHGLIENLLASDQTIQAMSFLTFYSESELDEALFEENTFLEQKYFVSLPISRNFFFDHLCV
jgi:hypothetical protein